MRELIHDIINDPREYWPILAILGAVLLVWGGLCVSGLISMRASTQRRRLWFALAPLIFGLMGVCAQIPLSLQRDEFQFHFDLGWLFLVPLLMGAAGFAFYWKSRQVVVKL